ncbi:DUF1572 family protein [Rossellomorea vietnamensis]|uniref:DUF1572 family protein n=1 Tax=Rossellomorea vietnamensis TaxID=218284 RepID=UPI003CEB736C
MDFQSIVIDNLISKFASIKSRMLLVIGQLTDDDINWRPNEESNSIANLIVHIEGNINQRIEAGILGKQDQRDREGEFDLNRKLKKWEAVEIVIRSFAVLENTLKTLDKSHYLKPQKVRQNTVTILDVLMQCSTHFSEHLGQILYIGKMKLDRKYITTSIPRGKSF